ncbi:hypothetical protein L6261_03750 [Candidatus Parcubacteria bacterium]|nr:hypothetical protein [Candidatus Parcubacteria bacterium]
MFFSKPNLSSKKILIIVLVLNLTALLVYVFLFINIKNKNENLVILKRELNNQIEVEKELDVVGSNLDGTKSERGKINSFFVGSDKESVVKFVEDVENLGDFANVSLNTKSILLKEREREENIVSVLTDMKLSLSVEGKWSDIVYFIELLKSMPYKISFSNVYLEKKGENNDGQGGFWGGSFNINVLKLTEL